MKSVRIANARDTHTACGKPQYAPIEPIPCTGDSNCALSRASSSSGRAVGQFHSHTYVRGDTPVSATLRKPVPGYRPDIDGLRAVAVISVVVFHAFPAALAGGFAGVDIFFAISGYLISQHIIETLDQRRFSLVDFYARRIKRIYPALITVMAACLAAGIVMMASGELEQLASDALASVAFVANLYFLTTRDYFSQGAGASVLLHLWSLGVEKQYYIVWPVVLYLLWRFTSRRVTTLVIAAVIVLSLGSSIVLSSTHAVAAFYLPVTRFWELLFGSALAWAEFHSGACRTVQAGATALVRRLPLRDLASFAGAALIGLSLALYDPTTVFPGWRAALPAGGATPPYCRRPAGGAQPPRACAQAGDLPRPDQLSALSLALADTRLSASVE